MLSRNIELYSYRNFLSSNFCYRRTPKFCPISILLTQVSLQSSPILCNRIEKTSLAISAIKLGGASTNITKPLLSCHFCSTLPRGLLRPETRTAIPPGNMAKAFRGCTTRLPSIRDTTIPLIDIPSSGQNKINNPSNTRRFVMPCVTPRSVVKNGTGDKSSNSWRLMVRPRSHEPA